MGLGSKQKWGGATLRFSEKTSLWVEVVISLTVATFFSIIMAICIDRLRASRNGADKQRALRYKIRNMSKRLARDN